MWWRQMQSHVSEEWRTQSNANFTGNRGPISGNEGGKAESRNEGGMAEKIKYDMIVSHLQILACDKVRMTKS